MRKFLASVALIVAALAGATLLHTITTPQIVAGTASDHSHIVSFEQFVKIEQGLGEPLTNLQEAYAQTAKVCQTVMTSRWQDRDILATALPASIQDVTLRWQVYSAVLVGQNPNKLTACVK